MTVGDDQTTGAVNSAEGKREKMRGRLRKRERGEKKGHVAWSDGRKGERELRGLKVVWFPKQSIRSK